MIVQEYTPPLTVLPRGAAGGDNRLACGAQKRPRPGVSGRGLLLAGPGCNGPVSGHRTNRRGALDDRAHRPLNSGIGKENALCASAETEEQTPCPNRSPSRLRRWETPQVFRQLTLRWAPRAAERGRPRRVKRGVFHTPKGPRCSQSTQTRPAISNRAAHSREEMLARAVMRRYYVKVRVRAVSLPPALGGRLP